MAEYLLRSFDNSLEVYSAGSKPEKEVNPMSIVVMNELGIDLSDAIPKIVDNFISEPFDYVITVCDNAKEHCPVFLGQVKNRLHIGFKDPADAVGTKKEVKYVYRKIRDQIKDEFYQFYKQIKNK
jgi:arsenate reductase